MTGRRSRFNLVWEILEAIEGGNNKPTHILYETKLSWTVLQEILAVLQEKSCIEKRNEVTSRTAKSVQYYLTPGGEEALQNLRYLHSAISGESIVV
ncbi:hypothetical protein E2P71_10355 [Candidatus Bathyarchaeota archaeon]|nr:hypothetical protein E2P71_10355 [Candidatus Bathyarchaeota archaeon]